MISLPARNSFWLLLLAAACSSQPVRVVRLPDGTRELTCDLPLWKCVARVDDYCKGASFEVLYGHDEQHLYGSPGSEVESRTSRAVVHCLGPHAKPVAAPARALPAASAAPAPAHAAAPASAAARPPAARACVPGSTQVCVGPGACSGGQACLADGTGFSPCDCGVPAGAISPAATPP